MSKPILPNYLIHRTVRIKNYLFEITYDESNRQIEGTWICIHCWAQFSVLKHLTHSTKCCLNDKSIRGMSESFLENFVYAIGPNEDPSSSPINQEDLDRIQQIATKCMGDQIGYRDLNYSQFLKLLRTEFLAD